MKIGWIRWCAYKETIKIISKLHKIQLNICSIFSYAFYWGNNLEIKTKRIKKIRRRALQKRRREGERERASAGEDHSGTYPMAK